MIAIRRNRTLDMRDAINRRDRQPSPDAAPRPRGVSARDWPPGLSQREARCLRALHVLGGVATTLDVLGVDDDDRDATLKALDQLVERGLVGRCDDTGHRFTLTNPTGRDLARALADH